MEYLELLMIFMPWTSALWIIASKSNDKKQNAKKCGVVFKLSKRTFRNVSDGNSRMVINYLLLLYGANVTAEIIKGFGTKCPLKCVCTSFKNISVTPL